MIKKILFITVLGIVFCWWLLLSHVTFFQNEEIWEYNDYCVVKYYKVRPFNPLGLYYSMVAEDMPIFVVLFDKEGHYIGQSAPFQVIDLYSFANSSAHIKCDPSKEYLFSLADGYSIDSTQRSWWDFILQYFH